QRMNGGGILLQLNSKEAAEWLRADDVMKSFLEHMGGNTSFKARTYLVIVHYAPTTFDPNYPDNIKTIEQRNNLRDGTISEARYIKPADKRSDKQTTAHLIIGFRSQYDANQMIRRKIFIDGKRCLARKLLQEPKRCLKCQKIGTNHMAAECKSTKDICARCGKEHKTGDCTAGTNLHCANCGKDGHGTADRQCPYFIQRLKSFQNRDPETKFKYFPSNDPRTW
ncbi:hypothetical protein BD779DRAFT_1425881, partial [Infundibulicybe gibba]